MAIQIGSLVRVNFKTRKQQHDPAAKLQGQAFVVKKRISKRGGTETKYVYELYGAKSKYGIPYWFLEDTLDVIEEGEIEENGNQDNNR